MEHELILFPFGGNAHEAVSVVAAINQVAPTWKLVGFVDDDADLHGRDYHGVPVLGGRDVLAQRPRAQVLACPGRPESFRNRDRVIAGLGLERERFATLIHPTVERGVGVRIGVNTLLMAGVVLTADVTVGDHCVVLPNTVLSHDVLVGDYALIGSNVSVSGSVVIEPKCYIGSGTRLIQEITIGAETLIGLGSVVIADAEPRSTLVGNPARALSPKPATTEGADGE